MAIFLNLSFIFLMIQPIVISQDLSQDPCTSFRYLYDDGSRSINCDIYHKESQDRFIDEGWRRVQIKDTGEDLMMPTDCVKHGYCGSYSGVWLNGTHPDVEDGVVDRTGCLSMFSSCCHTQYPIQIKNCSSYMVYNLKRTLGSDERYCFGESLGCDQPKANTPLLHSTTMIGSQTDVKSATTLSGGTTTHALRDLISSDSQAISSTSTVTVTAAPQTASATTTLKSTTVTAAPQTTATTTTRTPWTPTTVTAAPPTTTNEALKTPTMPQQTTTKTYIKMTTTRPTTTLKSTATLKPDVHNADGTKIHHQVIGEPISDTESDKDMVGLSIGLSVVIVILAIIASGFAVLYFRRRNRSKLDFDITEQAVEPAFKEDGKI